MKCKLCEKPIHNYKAEFHHFKIDEHHSADICSECIEKFSKWQQSILANLFPPKTAKKRFKKR